MSFRNGQQTEGTLLSKRFQLRETYECTQVDSATGYIVEHAVEGLNDISNAAYMGCHVIAKTIRHGLIRQYALS